MHHISEWTNHIGNHKLTGSQKWWKNRMITLTEGLCVHCNETNTVRLQWDAYSVVCDPIKLWHHCKYLTPSTSKNNVELEWQFNQFSHSLISCVYTIDFAMVLQSCISSMVKKYSSWIVYKQYIEVFFTDLDNLNLTIIIGFSLERNFQCWPTTKKSFCFKSIHMWLINNHFYSLV